MNEEIWAGRTDGDQKEHLRWHQIVKIYNDELPESNFWGILGFACDEGVRRNKGRSGAAEGPNVLRKFCSNFPYTNDLQLIDFGNISCEDKNLENAQEQLAEKVKDILKSNGKTIIFGGGHEVLFSHFSGIRKAFPDKKIGIINFDAHFDNRKIDPNIGASSGTGFWQIAQEDSNYKYLALGIQRNSNTQALFDTAKNNETQWVLAEDFDRNEVFETIQNFIDSIEILYVTVCLDVFSAAFAPGVSAVAYSGLLVDNYFKRVFRKVISSPKLRAFDVAELNPKYDIDNHTARLGASLIFEVVSKN